MRNLNISAGLSNRLYLLQWLLVPDYFLPPMRAFAQIAYLLLRLQTNSILSQRQPRQFQRTGCGTVWSIALYQRSKKTRKIAFKCQHLMLQWSHDILVLNATNKAATKAPTQLVWHKYNGQQAGTNTAILWNQRHRKGEEVPASTQEWLQPAHGSSLQNHHPRTECGKACIAQVRSELSIITSTHSDGCKSHWASVFSLALLVDCAHTATDRCSSSSIKKACEDRGISGAGVNNIRYLQRKKSIQCRNLHTHHKLS